MRINTGGDHPPLSGGNVTSLHSLDGDSCPAWSVTLLSDLGRLKDCDGGSLYDGEAPNVKDLLKGIISGLKILFGGLKESGSE